MFAKDLTTLFIRTLKAKTMSQQSSYESGSEGDHEHVPDHDESTQQMKLSISEAIAKADFTDFNKSMTYVRTENLEDLIPSVSSPVPPVSQVTPQSPPLLQGTTLSYLKGYEGHRLDSFEAAFTQSSSPEELRMIRELRMYLTDIARNGYAAIPQMRKFISLALSGKSPRLTALAVELDSHMNLIESKGLGLVLSDLAECLLDDPDKAGAYLKCFQRLSPRLVNLQKSVEELEKSVISLDVQARELITSYKFTMEEITKQLTQFSKSSEIVANLTGAFENLVVSLKRQDLLPSRAIEPTEMSSSVGTGVALNLLPPGYSGVLSGPYTVHLENGKITAVVTPPTNPELVNLSCLGPNFILKLLNLDQTRLLMNLAKLTDEIQAAQGGDAKIWGRVFASASVNVGEKAGQWKVVQFS